MVIISVVERPERVDASRFERARVCEQLACVIPQTKGHTDLHVVRC